jgi:hypothetical protein
MRRSSSTFDSASKYDFLSNAVGAKDREVVPEETYYSETANGDELIEIMNGKPVQDEEQGIQFDQRITSLVLDDLSSMVSHRDC